MILGVTIVPRRAIVTLRLIADLRPIADHRPASRPVSDSPGTRACPVGHEPPSTDPRDTLYKVHPGPTLSHSGQAQPLRGSSPRCAVAQSRLAGDVYPRTDVQLAQDVGDVGRDGPGGQEQPGGDLRVGQSLRDESGDLGFGRREAVP